MKLNTAQATAYFAKPDPDAAGLLIYGADGMRIALKRQQVVAALIGPQGEEEMRLTRIAAGDLRKEPALLLDATKAIGFFPGPRVALVEDANETVGPIITEALSDWVAGDAQIVVTAGALKPTSKLRKAFEAHPSANAAGIYDNPPTRDEIERDLTAAGITNPPQEAMHLLMDLARQLEPGDFRQTLEKVGLYKLNDPDPLSADDIAACAPASIEADVDDVLLVVGDGNAAAIGPVMQRLQAQGVNAVSLCIGAMRHFRSLHRAACDTSGRPQIWGPNRDKMLAQARNWGAPKLEMALTELTDTDLQLRSAGQNAPALALVERCFIRLAMLARR
ncbi:DNA polymerase III subunit delta [uncultured Tateyamaria sp.]|uniref:DNA polymerase III subunit delta n=1 Tax=uncultured Tateyamaria sp. TaxID=455651 RepID=UPI001D947C9E|nr:DNA polymerase III subunit delta [uncultured Tateyamaria sp.]MCB4378857.1 DNA polymerase III subunit delta [Synechococcus sp. MU1644]